MSTIDKILQLEKQSLDHWSSGNPAGYIACASDDIVYFDDIGANRGLQGKEAVDAHLQRLSGMIPTHTYEMKDVRLQEAGDTAILSYNYHPTAPTGESGTQWRTSVVYGRENDKWVMKHAHWTMHKEQPYHSG